MGLSWVLLKRAVKPCGGEDIVGLGEGAGVEVDGSIEVEINGHIGELVLLGSGSRDVEVNESVQLWRTERRVELERSAQKGLGDGEGGCHCGWGIRW